MKGTFYIQSIYYKFKIGKQYSQTVKGFILAISKVKHTYSNNGKLYPQKTSVKTNQGVWQLSNESLY